MTRRAQPETPYMKTARSVRSLHDAIFAAATEFYKAADTELGVSERSFETEDGALEIAYRPIPIPYIGGVTSVTYNGVTLERGNRQDAFCEQSPMSSAEHFSGVSSAFEELFQTHTETEEPSNDPQDAVLTALHDGAQAQDTATLDDIGYDLTHDWATSALSLYLNLDEGVEAHSTALVKAASRPDTVTRNGSDRFLVAAETDVDGCVVGDAYVFENIRRGTALFALHVVERWDGMSVDSLGPIDAALGVDTFQFNYDLSADGDPMNAKELEREVSMSISNGKHPTTGTGRWMRVNTGLAARPNMSFTEHAERMISDRQRRRSIEFTREVTQQTIEAKGLEDLVAPDVRTRETKLNRRVVGSRSFVRTYAEWADKSMEEYGPDYSAAADRIQSRLKRQITRRRTAHVVGSVDPPLVDNLHDSIKDDIRTQASETTLSVGPYKIVAQSGIAGAERLILPETQVVKIIHPDFGRETVLFHKGVYEFKQLSATVDTTAL